MKLSTGLRNHVVGSGSLKSALDGCVIRMYSGTMPATADAAVTGGSTLLCTVTLGDAGGGLTFEAGLGPGLLLKSPSENWLGTVAESGVATWFRLETQADIGDVSTDAIRVQGTIQYAGGDMQITDPNLLQGAPQKIDYFSVVMPAE